MSNVGQQFVLGASYIPTLKASDSVRRMMTFPRALLEDWMRDHYHDAVIGIGSSGVLDYSLARVLGFHRLIEIAADANTYLLLDAAFTDLV